MNPFTRTQLSDLTRAMDARDRQLRDEIRDALVQSGDQKYIDLAGEIHFKRLLANPAAVRCIDCQGRIEKTHAHEAMPRL